jgi:osmoprotectant transport system substrate-binding protein
MPVSPICSQISRRAVIGYASRAGILAACGARAAAPVVVASKIDTEGALLGSLIAQTLRAHNVPVRLRLQLGPTLIVRQALLSGAVDIYPEYTGNGAGFFHRQGDPAWHEAASAWRTVHDLDMPNGVTWLPAAPADNGWGIAVRRDMLAQLNSTSLADLATYLKRGGNLLLAASVEFVDSPDALPAFERAYGFRLRQEQILALAGGNTAATIRAAAEGISGINAAMAYTTDGALDALGLLLLDDPKHAQIVFQPAAVARDAVLRAWPELAAWLAPLFAGLSVKVLRRLNARIAVQGAAPAAVAADYLAGNA